MLYIALIMAFYPLYCFKCGLMQYITGCVTCTRGARACYLEGARAPAGYNLNPRLNPVSGDCIFPGVVDLRGLYVFEGCYLRGLHIFGGGGLNRSVYAPYNYVGARSLMRA